MVSIRRWQSLMTLSRTRRSRSGSAGGGAQSDSSEVDDVSIRLASGNMGVQAAVNEEIEISELPMMMYVYLTSLRWLF